MPHEKPDDAISSRVLMMGNEAAAEAAIRAGFNVISDIPITRKTS